MTKREAKRWVCGMAASLLISDLAMGAVIPEDEPDRDKKKSAFNELIRELERRGDEKKGQQP
jgi:hypothetical protein